MNRVEKLRSKRCSAHVLLAEYLKIRSADMPVLVFEGKQCPIFYINKIIPFMKRKDYRQFIACGKQNVLNLRLLIRKNLAISKDVVLFFVDKDYDSQPASGEFEDVYVTPGYSIENECILWEVIEAYIRTNFFIADADDEAAIAKLKTIYEIGWGKYVQESKELHKIVYICRHSLIRCIHGDDLKKYFQFDWLEETILAKFGSQDNLFELLQIEVENRPTVIAQLANELAFDSLDSLRDWIGKFHFSFVKSFLAHFAKRRTEGITPFSRAETIKVEPMHPSLFPMLSAYVQTPECLIGFIQTNLAH